MQEGGTHTRKATLPTSARRLHGRHGGRWAGVFFFLEGRGRARGVVVALVEGEGSARWRGGDGVLHRASTLPPRAVVVGQLRADRVLAPAEGGWPGGTLALER